MVFPNLPVASAFLLVLYHDDYLEILRCILKFHHPFLMANGPLGISERQDVQSVKGGLGVEGPG